VVLDDLWQVRTKRVVIRPMLISDADAWHDCRNSMPFDPQTRTAEESRAVLLQMQRRAHLMVAGWQQFAVLDRAGGAFLGDFGIGFDDPGPGQAMLGFAMMPKARGLGLAQEAGEALLDKMFAQGLRRVAAVTDIRNIAAQKLLARLGFVQEARYRQSWWDGSGWQDELGYARLVAD
jgi:aminoglycoside 6'-N-acetyltransferase